MAHMSLCCFYRDLLISVQMKLAVAKSVLLTVLRKWSTQATSFRPNPFHANYFLNVYNMSSMHLNKILFKPTVLSTGGMYADCIGCYCNNFLFTVVYSSSITGDIFCRRD